MELFVFVYISVHLCSIRSFITPNSLVVVGGIGPPLRVPKTRVLTVGRHNNVFAKIDKKIYNYKFYLGPQVGVEPTRPLRAKGF